MDYISLERLEPFNTPKHMKEKKVSAIDATAYFQKYNDLNGPFHKLRTKTYEALPVPPLVVPVMAFEEQVDTYQNMFVQESSVVDNLSVRDLMTTFSEVESAGQKSFRFSKFLLLIRFFQKIMHKNMNYDSAIICCDRKSESSMEEGLTAHGLNVRAISDMFPNKHVYGVIVKIRKDVIHHHQYTPVTRDEVDAMFVYDSACCVNVDRELKLIKGIKQAKPRLFYIACMDTAEIRLHTYNRCSPGPSVPIHWGTKVFDLTHDLQQLLLLQPSRTPDTVATVAWNDHLSQTLLNFIGTSDVNEIYQYKFPSKGALSLEVDKFILHHPTGYSSPKHDVNRLAADKTIGPSIPPVKSAPASSKSGSSSRPVIKSIPATMKTIINARNKPPKNTISSSKPTKTVASSSKHVSSSSLRRDNIPTVTSTGIHPERMAMLESKQSSPGSGNKSNEKKRIRPDDKTIPISAKRFAKAPAPDVIMEDVKYTPSGSKAQDSEKVPATSSNVVAADKVTRSSTAATSSNDVGTDSQGDKSPKTLASDFASKFNDFFNNALQKFENDILNIKF